MDKGILVLFVFLNFMLTCNRLEGQQTENWHYPLYLSNLNYWHSRIPVKVENYTGHAVAGIPVALKIGSGPGLLSLSGTNAGAIRVVDSAGNELLWRISSPDKKIITEGPIPDRGEFLLPVSLEAGETGTYYIYFENPDAWPIGAVLSINAREAEPESDLLKTVIMERQAVLLKEEGKNEAWPLKGNWNLRVPVRIMNFGKSKIEGLPVYVKMDQIFQRLHGKIDQFSAVRLGEHSPKPFFRFANAIVFDGNVAPQSEQTTYAYFSADERKDLKACMEEFEPWLKDPRNLVKNAGITEGESQWNRLTPENMPSDAEQGISNHEKAKVPGLRLQMPVLKEACEIGWTQNIAIIPGHAYMFGGMAACENVITDVSIKIKFMDSNGTILKNQTGTNKISGTTDWTFLSGMFKAPAGGVNACLSLTLSGSGTVNYTGMMMMEVIEGFSCSMFFDQLEKPANDRLTVWPVNSIVKVFHEDLPPVKIQPARITSAGNESEPLQLAIRSPYRCDGLRINIIPPANKKGQQLKETSVNIVGYVPIDYPSNYFGTNVPAWYLKYPAEGIGSDGWEGFWPDPLLPGKMFDLPANTTQPVWIEVAVPEGTAGGDYTGQVNIYQRDSLISVVPWTVHVWGFDLPQRNTFGATYDLREPEDISDSGMEEFQNDMTATGSRDLYWSFMAKHRINAGEITPAPKIDFKDGRVKIDFTEYDKAASYYFDELKNPFAYMPTGTFYLFGWAFPPSVKFNQKPYPGEYPYENADRGNLRPEYKQAYQQVLKEFWDHIKAKGWVGKFVLYLSDEPHMAENSKADINAQMRALCNMIHEVSRDIPVYVSTWNFRPEWDGFIDVWGIAYNGGEEGYLVPLRDYEHLAKSGARIWFTTDGNFCTDTPYLALERLLPYFGYKYGAEAYEFWGINWLTYNPYKYGWHSYIFESQAPGESSWKRYPDGDGFLIYPGKPIGQEGLVASIRLKQVREGAEDYEYLSMLGKLIEKARSNGQDVAAAQNALEQALAIVNIPCAMGRYSTRILKNPDDVYAAREEMAKNIEALGIK